ncbi:glycosyltransferase [Cellulomonas alba]|uniref:Glycosyltransferase n=1 Tax=Cellulomonas alba TaxID=3053467 RepID=A0ABT7SHC6_9CELL|nr:glycosyltransferase [Cellulomonas alba]MDM7855576.1 glycosyltransferase [Cellulomonas alba]
MAEPLLRVLQSFRAPRPTTNPYLVQLRDSLAERAEVATFGWGSGLRGRYDVLHVHWPEVVVERGSRLRHWAACAAFAAVAWRASSGGRALVRTVHNVEPHERQDRATAAVTRWCDARTTWWIRLNDRTPVPDTRRASTVPHGDYAAWFARYDREAAVPGRLVYAGLVRPYKGVEDLLDAFRDVPGDAELVVAGRPTTPALEADLRARAGADPRVLLDLRYVEDAALVRWVTSAELVVLPYRAMHNSGAALLALSLGRPVLVPRNAVTDDLAAEVGARWVLRYDGDLDTSVLSDALDALRAAPPHGAPDLAARAWPVVAEGHLAAYRAALAVARGSRVPARAAAS